MNRENVTWKSLSIRRLENRHANQMVRAFKALNPKWQDELDASAYVAVKWLRPVLGEPNLKARFLILGRDPGKDEVLAGKPFIGQTGQDLRPRLDKFIDVQNSVYWANTVPFKRCKNKVWPRSVQEQFFQPTLDAILSGWEGCEVITLGEHAFKWFSLGMDRVKGSEWVAQWKSTLTRFEPKTSFSTSVGGRKLKVYPLPHPSKASAKFGRLFPSLLEARLKALTE